MNALNSMQFAFGGGSLQGQFHFKNKRLMARRNTLGPISEKPDDEDYISSNDIRKTIVLSMAADDEDWSNYRRRSSSGGTAAQLFHQTRSRRSSRDDSSMNHTERKTSATSTELYSPDANDNYKSVEADKLQTDKILKYVKDRLDELGLDNVSTETKAAPPQVSKNSRRLGCASASPQLDVTSGENHELTSDVLMHRFTSDPGPPVTGKKVAFGKSLSVDPKLTSNHSDLLFDICGQTNENRFPWLRDQGTQVDTEALSRNAADKPGAHLFKSRGYTVYGGSKPRISNPVRPFSKNESILHLQDGMVVMKPEVFQESVEFYAEKAAEKMDLIEGDPMTNFRKGRRTCVIPTLELGDQAVEENSGSQAYPGDLVLTTGHSLRRQSPPLVNGNSSDHYGSEGSLIDTATPVKDERTKTLERKPKTSIFNIDRWRGKKAIMPELEYVLQTLVPTEFKDERLASKRHLHWQDLIDNPEEDLSNISEREKSRRDAVWEIFTNECTFLVDHLMVLKHCFMEPLLKCQVEGLLMDIEPPKLFGNLNELCDLSYRFCRDFYNQLKSLPMSEFASVSCLCDCLDIMTWYSRDGDIYHSYLLNYRSALTYLDILRNTLDDYALYEKFCEQDPRCNKLRLSDLLIAPMQHWTRLPLILERVRKYTTDQSDIDRLNSSTEKVVCSLKSLENKMEWLKTFERVKEIEKQLIWPTISEIDSKAFIPDTLKGLLSVQPTKHILDDKIREITFEGPLLLTEKDRNVDVYVFLFTDFLLFTKVKKKVRGRMSIIEKDGFYQVLRQPIPVHSLSVHDIGAAESNSSGMKNLFVIVQRNSFQQIVGVFSLQAHTSLGKQKWLSHLRDNKEKSRAEINNNGSQLSELASRQKTFRDMHEYGSYSSLLKHSQVLPLEAKTSHTLPRNHRNHIYAAPSTSSQSAAELTTDSNPPSTRQKRILDRSKTLSAGCLVSDRSFSLANGSPIK